MSTTYYAVAVGHVTGIYEDWPAASEQVTGYPGAVFQRFRTRDEAEAYLAAEGLKSAVAEGLKSAALTSSLLTTLTIQQQAVIHHLLLDKNVALLGAAGCGKSYLLSVIYTEFPGLKKRHGGKGLPRIQICAMTGCAALLLGHKAKTLHSWAGIGLGKGTVSELYTKIRRNTKSMRHWLCTDLLIIDEVSMMTCELLDKLNDLGKKIRGNKRPFGGIQVLLVGDFYQLPPVNRSEEATMFAFESATWKEVTTGTNGVVVELTEIQRQKDPAFQTILTEARMGVLSWESSQVLRERQGLDWKGHKIRPTLIFPRRAEVDVINESNLRALKGRRYTYKARLAYDGKMPDGFTEKDETFLQALTHYDANAAYAVELELALNAQVMLIANAFPEQGLVNGSRGVVVDFCSQTDLPIVEFVNGVRRPVGQHGWPIEEYEFVSRTQVPLRLAYAVTIHKCVSEDTLLSIPDMGLIKIKNMECPNQEKNTLYMPENISVCGVYENKQVIEIYKGSMEDGLSFTSAFGYDITTSKRHPLLTFNSDTFCFEWKTAPEITLDDYIIIKKGACAEGDYFPLNGVVFNGTYKKTIQIPDAVNEDVAYLLGVMLGDGSINDKTYRFDLLGIDYDILDTCVTILDNQFGIKVEKHACPERKTRTERIFFHCKQLIELLRYIGYNFQKADNKAIPDCILASPISVQRALIQGLYDTDGGVSKSIIHFTTTSEIMGQQLQQMLLNMGVTVSRYMMRDHIPENNWKHVYRLSISGQSAVKFVHSVGFRCERKMNKACELFYEKDTLQASSKSQSFEIPNGSKLIQNLRNEIRDGTKRIKSDKITYKGHKLLSSLIHKQTLRCESINVLLHTVDNIEQYPTGKLLSFIYHSGILIDKIKYIKPVSNIQMYDIGVSPRNGSGLLPDGHDFIGNGFVNHNCQGATIDAALIDIGSGIFEYGQAYVALSRVKSLDALYVHDFDPIAFRVHPKVKAFYQGLRIVEEALEDGWLEKILVSESKEDDVKQVRAEPSKAIRAIIVQKAIDDSEPGAPDAVDPDQTDVAEPCRNWLYDSVPDAWKNCLLSCEQKLLELSQFLFQKTYLPAQDHVWTALALTPLASVKVVILGQDPYPTPGNAHGLAFSVLQGVRPVPASLKNIYKELATDVEGFVPPGQSSPAGAADLGHGHLEAWAKRGVLLLNTVLTVEPGAPQSHSKIGWEEVTDQLIRSIAAQNEGVVFVLWGKSAQAKKSLLNLFLAKNKHRVFESAHPSPLSAHKGFFGTRPFSTVNRWLIELGKEPVDWRLT